MKEIWRDIKGYENLYQISNLGRIKTKQKKVNNRFKDIIREEKIIKLSLNRNGYYIVHLWKDGKSINKTVHRLVANAFIPNENKLPLINHKDENKKNNCVDNLEWCTYKYNSNYGERNKKLSKIMKTKNCKKIIAYDYKTNEIYNEYPSISECARELNISKSDISHILNNNHYAKSRKGLTFKFKK